MVTPGKRVADRPRRGITVALAVLLVVVSAIGSIWLIRAFDARRLDDLNTWHRFQPAQEFRAQAYPDGITLAQYLSLERRLAKELDDNVYAALRPDETGLLNRYDKTSLVHPGDGGQRWNWTYELDVADPRAGILLIHGASDSPYSMRALAERFQRAGLYVLAVRLPGNGTVPGGLLDVEIDDWIAIAEMGARHVAEQLGGDRPMYIGGYSIGATLAVHYAQRSRSDPELRTPDKLLLYSPAIAVSGFARFASWDVALSRIPYFRKFAWESVQPEYDPYKYNSFAKNAGDLAYRITTAVQTGMGRGNTDDGAPTLPPVIAFQSLVDATVSVDAVDEMLFQYLGGSGSALVLFDLNRQNLFRHMLYDTHQDVLHRLMAGPAREYDVTVISNVSPGTDELAASSRLAGQRSIATEPLQMRWPTGAYSLSHVAIPFEPADRWYGANAEVDVLHPLVIGTVAPRGEKGVLKANLENVMRLRYNPFFDYVVDRSIAFIDAAD